MSLVSQGRPARKRSVYGHNSTTSVEDVYVCPPNCTAEVNYIVVANGAASSGGGGAGPSNIITIQWYVAADTYTSHFLRERTLSGGEFVEYQHIQLVLSPGDKIQVKPESSGHIDSIITVTETFNN